MNETCGCCEGTQVVTPMSIANRPGLDALAYRVGTQASFLETMKARLSNMGVTLDALEAAATGAGEPGTQLYPLQGLTTRAENDPAIAFLDAWATVADVLTFYQERIANEGYLRTATERRSILELVRLVGYNLRPGVSASVFLAYTVDNGTTTIIPAGSRAQSVPDPGEQPQPFETSADLEARGKWNNLQPRLTHPTFIVKENADIIDTVYFQGTSTNLKPNDPLLLVFDDNSGVPAGQILRFVHDVEIQAKDNRTKVTLQVVLTDKAFIRAIQQTVAYYLDLPSFCVSATDPITGNVEVILADFFDPQKVFSAFIADVQSLQDQLTQAQKDGNAVIVTWLSALIAELEKILGWVPFGIIDSNNPGLQGLFGQIEEKIKKNKQVLSPPTDVASTQIKLGSLLVPLLKPASLQPANTLRLDRSVKQAFSFSSDIHPQLLTVLNPALGTTLYTAVSNAQITETSALESAQALRVKSAPFGHNAPLKPVFDGNGKLAGQEEWSLGDPVNVGITLNFDIRQIELKIEEAASPSPQSGGGTSPPSNLGNNTLTGFQISLEQNGVKQSKAVAIVAGQQTISFDDPFNITVTVTVNADSQHPANIDSVVFAQLRQTIQLTPQGSRGADIGVQVNQDPMRTLAPGETKAYSTNGYNIEAAFASDASQFSITDVSFTALPQEQRTVLALDAQFDRVTPGSWVVIERPDPDDSTKTKQIISKALKTETISRADYNITATVTQLTLDQPWLFDQDVSLATLRQVTVYAQSDEQGLTDEPIDPVLEAICGDTVELDDVYAGLKTGRWAIVTGERTDIFGVPGVTGTELVMLAGVTQGIHQVSAPAQTTTGGSGGTSQGNTQLVNLPDDKTHTFLKFASPLAYSYKRDTVTIYGNVAKATHGETRNEVLGSGDGSKTLQSFSLKQSPLTYLAAPTPAGAASTLKVYVNDLLWHETESLVEEGPNDRIYITKTDDNDKTTTIFGNGVHGARLPTGVENVKATYRSGIGKAGNVKANQISMLATRPLGVKAVINPLPASGGADRDSRDQARRNVPVAVLALDRLVSVQDYEDFARTYAGIGKASAVLLSDGQRQLVHLTIVGADNIPIDKTSDLYLNLFQALRQYGDPQVPLQVDLCQVLLLVISASIEILPDYLWEVVALNIRIALLDAFSFDNRNLGQPVFQSEVISIIQNVEGVAYVHLEIMDAVDQDALRRALDKIANEQAGSGSGSTQGGGTGSGGDGSGTDTTQADELTNDLGLVLQPSIPVSLAGPVYYTVKQGDSLSSIAQLYGVSVADLRKLNPQFSQQPGDTDPLPPGITLLVQRIRPAQLAFLTSDVPDTLILREKTA
jgi:hypothetical protein